MKRVFTYQNPYYAIEVTLTGIFCIEIAFVSVCCIAFNLLLPRAVFMLALLVSCYQIWNTFVSGSNPKVIELSEEVVSFNSYGRIQKYDLKKVNSFLVREFPSSGKIYLRVNDASLLSGRFWIPTKMFNDSEELFSLLRDLEYKIHPDSLKARARRTNEEYLKRKKR